MTSYLDITPTLDNKGIRNNNPFNIKDNPAYTWDGQIGVEPEGVFCQFSTIEYGIRAGFYNLINGYFYASAPGPYDTIRKIIERYSVTDQEAYISFVSGELQADENAILVPTTDTLLNLGRAIMRFEVGTDNYNTYITENMIIEGYNMVPAQIGDWTKDTTATSTEPIYSSVGLILLLILAGTFFYKK